MPAKQIDAVLFDLGNTLVSYYKAADFNPILEQCVTAIAEVMWRHEHAVDIESIFAYAKELNRERPDGRVWPLAHRLQELLADHQQALSDKLLDEMTIAFLQPIFATGKPDTEAVAVLNRIKELGLKSAIVSNTPWGSPSEPWKEELSRWGLLDAVDEAVFCVDVGWRKPAPKVFEHALSLLDVRPDRALFVGDDVRWDVEGANRAGLTPVLITKSDGYGGECQSIRSLRELLSLVTD